MRSAEANARIALRVVSSSEERVTMQKVFTGVSEAPGGPGMQMKSVLSMLNSAAILANRKEATAWAILWFINVGRSAMNSTDGVLNGLVMLPRIGWQRNCEELWSWNCTRVMGHSEIGSGSVA